MITGLAKIGLALRSRAGRQAEGGACPAGDHRSREVPAGQTEAILDGWYGFIGSKPFLRDDFRRKADGQSGAGSLAAVRERFGQWLLDTAEARYDLHPLLCPVVATLKPFLAKKGHSAEAAEARGVGGGGAAAACDAAGGSGGRAASEGHGGQFAAAARTL